VRRLLIWRIGNGSTAAGSTNPRPARFPSATSSSSEHCEDGSTDRGNLLRGRKKGKKRDDIGEFVLIGIPERKCGFCEDIGHKRRRASISAKVTQGHQTSFPMV
jgi:hypothetical protein